MEKVLPQTAPDDDIRHVRSSHLSQEQIDALDGAPVLDPEALDGAIITVFGNKSGEGFAVYDYNEIISIYAKLLVEDGVSSEDSYEQACEWVGFNTLPSLVYTGDRQPIVVHEAIEDEPEEGEQHVEINGKTWVVEIDDTETVDFNFSGN